MRARHRRRASCRSCCRPSSQPCLNPGGARWCGGRSMVCWTLRAGSSTSDAGGWVDSASGLGCGGRVWRQGVAAGMWRRVTMVPIIPIPWGAAAAAAGGAAEEACCGTGAVGAAARAAPVFCGLPRGGGGRAAGAAPPFFLPKPLARAAPRVSIRGRAVGVAWLAHIVPELLRSHALSHAVDRCARCSGDRAEGSGRGEERTGLLARRGILQKYDVYTNE